MPEPTDKIIGVNHEGANVHLRATGERYYYKDGLRSATVSLHDADLTAGLVFYVFRSWFTTQELEWHTGSITFHGLKEEVA